MLPNSPKKDLRSSNLDQTSFGHWLIKDLLHMTQRTHFSSCAEQVRLSRAEQSRHSHLASSGRQLWQFRTWFSLSYLWASQPYWGSLDWTMSTRLSRSSVYEFQTMIFPFQTSDISRSLAVHVLGREGSFMDEKGMWCDNVKLANQNWRVLLILDLACPLSFLVMLTVMLRRFN